MSVPRGVAAPSPPTPLPPPGGEGRKNRDLVTPLDNVCCARLPLAALPALAGLRCWPALSVRIEGDWAWLRWPAGDEGVLRRVLPLEGAALYETRDGLWYQPGHHLPAFDVPHDEGQPLGSVLFPEPVEAEPPPVLVLRPDSIRLARDETPRPATGMRCGLAELARWAETATSARLARVRVARSAERVLLLGRQLPALPNGRRLWGERVLAPLGFRPEPALPEKTLLEALGAAAGEFIVLDAEGAEVVPADVFGPLTRAAVRLAVGGRA